MWRATLMEQHAGGFGVHTPFHFGWSDGTLQDHSTGTMTDQYPPPQNPNTETCSGRVASQYLHLHSSNTSLSTRRTAGHYHYQWNTNFGTSTTMATSQYPNSQFPTTNTSTREINDQNPYPLHPNTGTETETVTFQNPHPQHPITSKTTKRTTSNQTSYWNPTYWNPTYQDTSLWNPSHQETSYQNPSYQDTSYQNPSFQNASLRNPSYQNPRYQDASLRNPRYQDASYRNPNHQNPSHQDASYWNPSHQDASYWNPSHQDASYVNPSAGTSASMTIPAIAPTPRIPARTPRGTPATWTRTPEPLSPGQQTSVSSQATCTRTAEHQPWWLLACTPIPLPEQPLSTPPHNPCTPSETTAGHYFSSKTDNILKEVIQKLAAKCEVLEQQGVNLYGWQDYLLRAASDITNHINKLEAFSRWNNMRFFNVCETPNEDYSLCARKVVRLLNEFYPFKTWMEEDVEHVHRVGPKGNNQPCLLLARMHHWSDKLSLLSERMWSQNMVNQVGVRVAANLTDQQQE